MPKARPKLKAIVHNYFHNFLGQLERPPYHNSLSFKKLLKKFWKLSKILRQKLGHLDLYIGQIVILKLYMYGIKRMSISNCVFSVRLHLITTEYMEFLLTLLEDCTLAIIPY